MSNVAQLPRRARLPQLDAENVAISALWNERHSNNRAAAISGAVYALQEVHGMPNRAAENAAAQAMAELDTLNTPCAIDVDATTSQGVVMRLEGGARLLITTRDLRDMLKGHVMNAATDELFVIHR